jgi:hypothetical protein
MEDSNHHELSEIINGFMSGRSESKNLPTECKEFPVHPDNLNVDQEMDKRQKG